MFMEEKLRANPDIDIIRVSAAKTIDTVPNVISFDELTGNRVHRKSLFVMGDFSDA